MPSVMVRHWILRRSRLQGAGFSRDDLAQWVYIFAIVFRGIFCTLLSTFIASLCSWTRYLFGFLFVSALLFRHVMLSLPLFASDRAPSKILSEMPNSQIWQVINSKVCGPSVSCHVIHQLLFFIEKASRGSPSKVQLVTSHHANPSYSI